jgi:hypothetical protein
VSTAITTAPVPGQGVDPGWLSARQEADASGRAGTVEELLPPLVAYYERRSIDRLQVVDLGAGRGANQQWLRPRLPFAQHWTHVDYDVEILHHDRLPDTTYVCAPVEALPRVLSQLAAGPVLVTCSALLDVLARDTLMGLCGDFVRAAIPALFSLNVTGAMVLDPPEPDDEALLTAFNAHQRRDQRAGPQACDLVLQRFESAGVRVETCETPWRLAPTEDSPFVDQFLRERVAAAVEQVPELAERGAAWLERRRNTLRQGRLRLTVGHRDLLILPD